MKTSSTASTTGAQAHARAMAGTVVDAMPTMPAAAAEDLPEGVVADPVVWDEVVAGAGYAAKVLPAGARLRIVDRDGDGCAGLLLHRADHPAERLNVADTVKVQWQAYLGAGALLLSDMGRVLATIVADTSGRHDALCGTSHRAGNERRYADGAADGPCPNGRDRFAVALAKAGLGLDRRDIVPNVNFFKGVRVLDDGSFQVDVDPTAPGAYVELRCELPVLVTVVNVPHPLDPRPDYCVTPLRLTAWRADVASPDDAVRTSTPERERAFLNTEAVR